MYASERDARHVNGVVTDARAGKGTIGKLLMIPHFTMKLGKQVEKTGIHMARRAKPGKVSLGKLRRTTNCTINCADASGNLSSATAKLNDNTTTAGKLFSDPSFTTI